MTGLNVDVESTFGGPAPEPGTLAFVGAGLLALAWRTQKFRRAR